MKRSYIFILAIIAAAMGIIISNLSNASTYATFTEAQTMAENGRQSAVHVVGTLQKDDQGNVTGIHASPSQMEFSFDLVDNDGRQMTVHYPKPMPTDFMSSEQVVVAGGYRHENGETYFLADEILLKCPSKYEEKEL